MENAGQIIHNWKLYQEKIDDEIDKELNIDVPESQTLLDGTRRWEFGKENHAISTTTYSIT